MRSNTICDHVASDGSLARRIIITFMTTWGFGWRTNVLETQQGVIAMIDPVIYLDERKKEKRLYELRIQSGG